MCKVLVTDGMNKNAIDRLRKFNIDIEHKFYDGMELGEKLKDLRTAAGLSLIELEEATGISKSALGSYESDDTKKEITI